LATFSFISVGYVTDGREVTVSLEAMRRHCRPDRVDELLADLAMLCDDVVDSWHGSEPGCPAVAITPGASR
jgi:hypothetical protein